MSELSDTSSGVADVDVFGALANPVRRRLLELLMESPRNAGALAAEFQMSRSAISEHLQVLRRAELVREHVHGRERVYELAAGPLTEVTAWLHPFEAYWRARLSDLATFLEEEPEP